MEEKEWVKRKRLAREILKLLSTYPELSAYEISKIERSSYATVRKYLKILEDMGYVKCIGEVPSERGGGKKAYTITEKGEELIKELREVPAIPTYRVPKVTPRVTEVRTGVTTLGTKEPELLEEHKFLAELKEKKEPHAYIGIIIEDPSTGKITPIRLSLRLKIKDLIELLEKLE